jgi:DNA-damage-inducible protein J
VWHNGNRGICHGQDGTIRARVEPELKRDAEAVLKALGLNASEAITLFYRQVALRRGLPFEIKLPNETTRAAMRDALDGKDLTEWSDLDELKAAHG